MSYRSIEAMGGEPTVNMFLRQVVSPGDTVFDVGANVGWLTTVMSRLVGPTGRVVAFEPGPIVATLAESLNEQRCVNTYIEHAAVTETSGYAKFIVPDNHVVGRMAREDGEHQITVPTWSLTDYCARRDLWPSVIKLDIEGFEADAIRGAKALIQRARPVIIFEQCRDDLAAIGLLRDHGYEITNLHDYLPCNTAEDFRGVVQNLVAWLPEHDIFLHGLELEEVRRVPFHRTETGLRTDPISLPAGRYVVTVDLPGDTHMEVSFGIEHEGAQMNSDGPLAWLAQGYGAMPWFSDRETAPVIHIDGLSGDARDLTVPPVKVQKLVSRARIDASTGSRSFAPPPRPSTNGKGSRRPADRDDAGHGLGASA